METESKCTARNVFVKLNSKKINIIKSVKGLELLTTQPNANN